jgi:hypothetical protein
LAQKLSTDHLEDAMSPKLISLGVIVIVLWIMMMIVAPPQDRTHYSADAGDFASSSAMVAGPWGVVFTNGKRPCG